MHFCAEFILLAFWGLIGVAHGLSCYTCTSSYFAGLTAGLSGMSQTDKCFSPDSTVSKLTCTGQCKTTFQSGSVTRMCASSCTASTSSSSDTTCCSTDDCNSGGPQGAGWSSCHKCIGTGDTGSCANKGFVPVGKYEACFGQCYKLETEAKILSITTKSVARGCQANCTPGKDSGGITGLVSGTSERTCCSGNQCNTSTNVRAFTGLLIAAAIMVFGI